MNMRLGTEAVPQSRRNATEDDAIAQSLFDLFDPLASYFYRRLANAEDAADAAAETIEILLRKRRNLPAGSEIRPYAFGVARNVLRHAQRRGIRAAAVHLRMQVDAEVNSQYADTGETRVALQLALETLDEKDRELITLVAWDGLSLVDAAKVIGVSAAAARKRYSRGRVKLREALG